VSGVDQRAFFHKLAQLGHVPEDREEADALYTFGLKLAALDPTVNEPNPFTAAQPQPRRGKYASIVADFDKVLGTESHEKHAEQDSIYDAAYALAQDPAIYGAALLLKQAQAAQAA
jgi:hypothetical protein